jgi:hypothetical protein
MILSLLIRVFFVAFLTTVLCSCNQSEAEKIENKVSAKEMQEVYLHNEVAYTEKYKNKLFEGIGTVNSIRENPTKDNSVWVSMIEYDSHGDRYITCESLDRNFSSELSPGDKIHFIGKVGTYNMLSGGIVLADCSIFSSIKENVIKLNNIAGKAKWVLTTCFFNNTSCYLVERSSSENKNGIVTFKGYSYYVGKLTNIAVDRDGEFTGQIDCKNRQYRIFDAFGFSEKTNRVERLELNNEYKKIDDALKGDDASKFISAFCN